MAKALVFRTDRDTLERIPVQPLENSLDTHLRQIEFKEKKSLNVIDIRALHALGLAPGARGRHHNACSGKLAKQGFSEHAS